MTNIDTILLLSHWAILILTIIAIVAAFIPIDTEKNAQKCAIWCDAKVAIYALEPPILIIIGIFLFFYGALEAVFIFNYIKIDRFPVYEIFAICDQIILTVYFIWSAWFHKKI